LFIYWLTLPETVIRLAVESADYLEGTLLEDPCIGCTTTSPFAIIDQDPTSAEQAAIRRANGSFRCA
jgi:hypothetical protein